MALGTLDHTPPPFFRQGLSALTKLSFCSALALFLMVADARFHLTQPLRASVAARDLAAWSHQPGDRLPDYNAGRSRQVFVPGSGEIIAWTAQPLQRWTPIGWRDSCRVYLRASGVTVEKAGIDHQQSAP